MKVQYLYLNRTYCCFHRLLYYLAYGILGMKTERSVSKFSVHRYRVYQHTLCVGRLCDVAVEISIFYNEELAVNLVLKQPTIKRRLNGATNGSATQL
jgi:hypothetical protein